MINRTQLSASSTKKLNQFTNGLDHNSKPNMKPLVIDDKNILKVTGKTISPTNSASLNKDILQELLATEEAVHADF